MKNCSNINRNSISIMNSTSRSVNTRRGNNASNLGIGGGNSKSRRGYNNSSVSLVVATVALLATTTILPAATSTIQTVDAFQSSSYPSFIGNRGGIAEVKVITSPFNIANNSNRSSNRKVQKLHVKSSSAAPSVVNTSGKGFAQPIEKKITPNKEQNNENNSDDDNDDDMEIQKQLIMKMNPTQLKEKLLSLLPRMTGTPEEFRLVEHYVNALEDKFIAPQTLDFFNLATVGEWQFLFTTNQLGRPSPRLRLTELVQSVEVDGFDGVLTNRASWDLAQDGMTFDARGTFASVLPYKINQGARMTLSSSEEHDLKIELSRGSTVPSDPQELVGLIHRAMPTELFDSSDLAMDTTYLDTDIRIVRFTGSRHEGVRNIFMRKGLIEINPSGMDMD